MNETLARMILDWVKSGEINSSQGLRLYEQLEKGSADLLGNPSAGSGRRPQIGGLSPASRGAMKETDPIAVTGMAGVFPDAPDLDQFWENLAGGRDSVREIDLERWNDPGAYHPDPRRADKTYCKWGGLAPGIDLFDPLFFNISPKEAEMMDPQQRLFLMEAWKALEDAGYSDRDLDGENCSVFVGYAGGDYEQKLRDERARPDAYTFAGNTGSILAARISYFLNLLGPSLAIDTACSSSLVAIHLACESLRQGACRLALAGGVMVGVTPRFHILSCRSSMLSRDGRCKTFDAGANGFVPGEGVGVVVLKRLRDALEARDHIHGVINGSGANQDGKTSGITAPSATSQTALASEVYERFGISPAEIHYVEAHGTGTELGDPIEIQALTDAFAKQTGRRNFCAVGSVKTNIGHTLTAAGVAGLIKTLLCLKHRKLVPSLHFKTPNPHIDFAGSPFYVNTSLTDWKTAAGEPRQAVVSSFGLSGTNAHLAVREAPPARPRLDREPPSEFLVALSAKTKTALARKIRDLRDWLEGSGAAAWMPDLSFTLAKGRSHFKHRIALVARDLPHLKEVLRRLQSEEPAADSIFTSDPAPPAPAGSNGHGRLREPAALTSGFSSAILRQAARYARGEELDWNQWFEGTDAGRISMPTYPFDCERYWIPTTPPAGNEAGDDGAPAAAAPGPLIFRHSLQKQDWRVDHHRVAGERILPGVACLEWIQARLHQVWPGSEFEILNFVWMRPIVVRDAVELELEFKPQGDEWQIEVRGSQAGEVTIHARGVARRETGRAKAPPPPVPLDAIRAACVARAPGDGGALYERFRQMGLEYSGSFQAVRELWAGSGQALGRLETTADGPGFDGNPALTPLLDGALQCIAGIWDSPDQPPRHLSMPFSLGRWKMSRPAPRQAHAHARGKGEGLYDVLLTDEHGGVCVEFQDLALRVPRGPDQDFSYVPCWERRPLAPRGVPWGGLSRESGAGSVLCVAADKSASLVAERVLESLPGHPRRIRLEFGAETRQARDGRWEVGLDDLGAFERILPGDSSFSTVLFIAGKPAGSAGPEESLSAAEASVQGVLRLIQACVQQRWLAPQCRFVFLTDTLFAVARSDEPQPWAAAVAGLAAAFRSEYPEWNISLIDWSPRTVAEEAPGESVAGEDLRALAEEIEKGSTGLTGLRGGKRFERVLKPVEIQTASRGKIKSNGAYLIVGGAGGLGFQFGLYLAEKYQALVGLLGRQPDSPRIQGLVRALEARGGRAFYAQADVADLDSLRGGIQAVKARLGPIQGVVHSAIVLEDGLIRNMTADSLRRVLAPKMRGTVNLDLALRDEPLDFMAVFSSAQSFHANAGQGNYVSASHFQDAYAAWLSRHRPHTVCCLNWGYWGSVGIVSGEEFRRRLAAQGFDSIAPREGVETVDRILNSSLRQVVCARANAELLGKMGLEENPARVLSSGAGRGVVVDWAAMRRPVWEDSAIGKFQGEFNELVELGFARLASWMAGRLWPEAAPGPVEDLAGCLDALPVYGRLCRSLAEAMVRRGLLRSDERGLWPGSALETRSRGVQGIEEAKNALLRRSPEMEGYASLLWNCLDAFPDILRGSVNPTEVMFPGGSVERMTSIYRGNPLSNYFNQMVAETVAAAVERAPGGPDAGPVRILEIGAGVGGTSSFVLERLRQAGAGAVEYYYTDISGGFVRYGRNQFGEAFPFARFQVLDVEADFPAQGIGRQTMDVILGANVFHATRSIGGLMSRLKAALRPGGLLVINEITALNDFATMTYGLTNGWWQFEDAECRIPCSPLLTMESWKDALWEAGFQAIDGWSTPKSPGAGLSQSVILGQSNGMVELKRAGLSAPRPPAAAGSGPPPPGLSGEPAEPLVVEVLSRVLKIKPERLELDTTFDQYGVDSLVVLEINKQFELKFGPLPATLLFEQKTVRALAAHFVARFPESFKPAPDLSPPAPAQPARGSASSNGHHPVTSRDPSRAPEVKAASQPEEAGRSGETPPLQPTEDIAVIGLAGRYPRAETIGEFWQNLRAGKNCVSEVPPERWDWRDFFHPTPHTEGKTYSRWGGFIQGVDQFDPFFFNISPREAERMDPQERLFLMTVWRLLEDAGYCRRDAGGPDRSVGVFVGAMHTTYGQLAARAWERGHWTGAFSGLWSIANRVSYFYDFQGPSLAVDTACSSSLVAIHLACESLRRRECELAVAGGVNLILDPTQMIGLSSMDMLSRGDRVRAFGAQADGFVDGEGVGAVLLKPLARAISDGDRIYGVIKGSSINTGGKTGGYTVPNPQAQTAVIVQALRRANLDPNLIGYVEAHGTGTALGDPIEVHSLAKAYGRPSGLNPKCAIGSVKSNIGHLEAAAGIAGITKALLQLSHGELTPSLHSAELNPMISFAETPFVVQQTLQPWLPIKKGPDGQDGVLPRRAAVSSFGAGGANAHLILEEYVPPATPTAPVAASGGDHLIVLSARTAERLQVLTRQLLEHLRAGPGEMADGGYLRRLAHTLQTAREPMLHRLAAPVSSLEELDRKLAAWLESGGAEHDGVFAGEAAGVSIARELISGEAGRAYLAVIRERKEWPKLARLWCQGIEIDWSGLHERPAPAKVAVPGYPFALKRYWIAESSAVPPRSETKEFSPDGLDLNDSLQEGLRYRWSLDPLQPWIRDHRFGPRPVLPGVVLLEMALQSLLRFQPGNQSPRLSITWLEPLVFSPDERNPTGKVDVRLRLAKKDSQIVFEIESETLAGIVTHAQGAGGFFAPAPEVDRVSPGDLIGRCPWVLPASRVAEACRRAGVEYGDFYRSFLEIRCNDLEAAGWLEIPEAFLPEAGRFHLHPALLDGAVQVCGAHQLECGDGGEALHVPFAVERVELLRALPKRVLAHARRVGGQTYAVDLLDPAGVVCARLHDLNFRKMRDPLLDLFYRPVWRMTHAFERLAEPGAGPPNHPSSLIQALVVVSPRSRPEAPVWFQKGRPGLKTIEVRLAGQTRPLPGDTWELNPAKPAQFLDWLGLLKLPFGCVIWQEPALEPPGGGPADEPWAPRELRDLFKLLKLFLVSPSPLDARQIALVTEGAFEVEAGEAVHPPGAAGHGLIQTLGHEYPGVLFSSVDLDPGATDAQSAAGLPGPEFARWILAEQGRGVALRNGRRYQSVLEAAGDLPPCEPGLRPGGVYLVVGGTGGVGLELSLQLARRYQARLILTSRHEPNPEQKGKLELIRAAGGDVLHLQADASCLESMRRVLRESLARFGAPQGVFHSAMVLQASRFQDLDESVFFEALRPKVGGAAALREIFGAYPLDFLAFFSSTQSFVGDAGQAPYAAASRWLDSLAGVIRRQAAYPVHLFNWGYWDPGLVVTEGVKQQLAEFSKTGPAGVQAQLKALGYGTISSEEALAALERTLGQKERFQRAVVRADADVLQRMGAGPVSHFRPAPGEPAFGTGDPLDQIEPGAEPSGRMELFDQAIQKLQEWGRGRALQALQSLGGFTSPGDRRTREGWFASLGVRPDFRRFFEALLALLARGNLLEENAGGIALRAPGLPDAARQARLLAELTDGGEQPPGFPPFLRLARVCCDHYPDLLTGRTTPAEILFPGGGSALVQGVYHGNPTADYCNLALARGLQSLAARATSSKPAGSRLRVLEVGAGTGGTTRELLPLLDSGKEPFQYTFTDLSSALVLAARKEFGPAWPAMEFRLLDLEKDATRQGFREGDYDIVIAANCLHATRDIRATLRQVKRLLKRGGFLLLSEASGALDLLTMTFGLLDGWWLFTDPDLRIPHFPLLSRQSWETLLREEGFVFGRVLGRVALGGLETAQIVLAAGSDGRLGIESGREAGQERAADRRAPAPPAGSSVPQPALSRLEAEPEAEETSSSRAGEQDEKMRRLEGGILACLAQALQTTPAELEPGLPFADYGVDSILAVEIIARLNDALGVSLRSTDLFNYPDVVTLASHVLERHDAAIDWKKPAAEPPAEAKAQAREDAAPTGVLDAESAAAPPDQALGWLQKLSAGDLGLEEVEELLGRNP